MLKLQRPNRMNEYEKIDASRINELHLAGFFPEYLDGLYVYFKKSDRLTKFLNGEVEVPEVTSGYLQVEPILDFKDEDVTTTTNVEPDDEPMIVELQPAKKEYKAKKMVVKTEVSEDE